MLVSLKKLKASTTVTIVSIVAIAFRPPFSALGTSWSALVQSPRTLIDLHLLNSCPLNTTIFLRNLQVCLIHLSSKRLSNLHRLTNTTALNNEVVEFATVCQVCKLDHEVAAESTADTSILHLDELSTLSAVEARYLGTVDVYFGHIVDDEGDFEAMVGRLKDMGQEGGFTASLNGVSECLMIGRGVLLVKSASNGDSQDDGEGEVCSEVSNLNVVSELQTKEPMY